MPAQSPVRYAPLMKTDIVIEIMKFGRQNLLDGNVGVTIEDIFQNLIAKKLITNSENDKRKVQTFIGQIFTDTTTNEGKNTDSETENIELNSFYFNKTFAMSV